MQIKRSGSSQEKQWIYIHTQDGRNLARKTAVIYRCVQSGRRPHAGFSANSSEEKRIARDPNPDVQARQDFRSIMRNYTNRSHVAPRTLFCFCFQCAFEWEAPALKKKQTTVTSANPTDFATPKNAKTALQQFLPTETSDMTFLRLTQRGTTSRKT